VKTSSFFTTINLAGRISVARYEPKVAKGIPAYRGLAPGPWFNRVDRAEYEQRYAAQLAKLSPQATWDALHQLAGNAPPLLLCWETTNWRTCHRRLVSRWFADTLGEVVPELGQP
jgi:Protein of unknown function, DUF488